MAGAQRRVSRQDDGHRAIHPRQLFDHPDVLDVSQARAPVLGGEGHAHQTHLAEF